MVTIKVSYGSIIRRFTVPNNTTWSSFESQLRSLFQIPSQIPISLSYTDEDGDIITLSSDLELKDILSDQELFGSSIKFGLLTPEELVTNETDSWVLEGSAAQIKEEGFSKSVKDSDVVSFSSSDEDASPIIVDESKEQNSKEPHQSFVFTEPSESQKNQNYKHVMITDEETEEPTFKSTIVSQQPEISGESSSSSFIVEEDKFKELPKNETKQPESDQSTDNNNEESIFWIYHNDNYPRYDDSYYNLYCHYSPFRFSRIHHTRRRCSAFYKFMKFILSVFLIITILKSLFFMICPLIKILILVFALKYLKGLCHKNYDDDEGNDERFCSFNRFRSRCQFGRCNKRRWNRNNQCYQRREYDGNFSEEIVAEKVKVLRDMGFEGENFEELVKLYNGNIDFVVETLVQQ